MRGIQDLYPSPPVLRYHRITPREERIDLFGLEQQNGNGGVNWLHVAMAFLAGYLIGGRRR